MDEARGTGDPARASLGRDIVFGLVGAAVAAGALEWTGGVWLRVTGPDLHAVFLAKYAAIVHALFVEHRLPLWNPYEFCGLPLLGVAQAGALYVPMWLAFGLLPPRAGLQAFYTFHLAVLGVGAAVYLRRHAVPGWAAAVVPVVTVAGLVTGITYSGYDHPSFLASVAWVPWMLLALEEGIRRGLRPWAGLLALLVAGQWLAGYPDFPMDTAVLLGVLALILGAGSLPRALAMVVVGVTLGTGLAALQLLALGDALAESARSDPSLPFAVGRGFFAVKSPGGLASDLVSRQGVVVPVLAMLAVLAPSRARIAWLVALAWAVFAQNRPFSWLYLLPPFSGIRFPFGWTGLGPFFLGCLAAATVSLVARARPWLRPLAWGLAAIAIAESGRIVIGLPGRLSEVAPDLALIARRAEALRPPAGERTLSPPDAVAGAPLRHELRAASGWEPSLAPRRIVRLLQAAMVTGVGPSVDWEWSRVASRAPLVSLLGVGVVAVPKTAVPAMARAGFRPTGAAPPDDVVMHAPGVPRARLVHRLDVVADEEESFARVCARTTDDGSTAVIETSETLPPVAPASSAERVTIVEDVPERVAILVDAAAPGLLVLGDTYYRGWEASVDGDAVPIVRADYAFRGVPVGQGQHRVEFRYRPWWVRAGAVVSGLAAAAVLVLLVSRPARSSAR